MKKIQQLTNPKIAIVGCGAVGLFYGAKLASSGQDVRFLMRSDYDHVKRYGVTVESLKDQKQHLRSEERRVGKECER